MNKQIQSKINLGMWLVFLVILTGGVHSLQCQEVHGIQPTKQQPQNGEVDQLTKKPETLWQLQDRMQQEINSIDKQLKSARDEIKTAATESKRVTAELGKKISNDRSRLSDLVFAHARCEAAEELGREACLDEIWFLEQSGNIQKGSLKFSDDSGEIAELIKIKREVQVLLDQAVQEYGSDHVAVQALSQAIDEQNAKISKLASLPAEIVGDTPEQVVRRFVVDAKQQIDEIKSILQTDLRKSQQEFSEFEQAKTKVRDLLNQKKKLVAELEKVDEQVLKQQSAIQKKMDGQNAIDKLEQRKRNKESLKLLQKMSTRFHQEAESVNKQLIAVRRKDNILATNGPSEKFERVFGESMKKIVKQKNQLEVLLSDFARSEEALEKGREACVDHILLLEADGKLGPGFVQSTNDNAIKIVQEKRMVEELELQRDQLVIAQKIGPDQPQVQALNHAIQQRDAKIVNLAAASSKIFGVAPEKVLQRHIIAVKQQIGDLRSSLSSGVKDYRKNYKRFIKSERNLAESAELKYKKIELVAKLKQTDELIIKLKSSLRINSP